MADTPSEFRVLEEGRLTAEAISNDYPDPTAYLERLYSWGFSQGAWRVFQIPSAIAGNPAQTMFYFTSSAIEYGSQSQAANAVQYQLNNPYQEYHYTQPALDQQCGLPVNVVRADYTNGSVQQSVALSIIQDGRWVYRFAAVAGMGVDPFPDGATIVVNTMQHVAGYRWTCTKN